MEEGVQVSFRPLQEGRRRIVPRRRVRGNLIGPFCESAIKITLF
jgi:hypothetical protein